MRFDDAETAAQVAGARAGVLVAQARGATFRAVSARRRRVGAGPANLAAARPRGRAGSRSTARGSLSTDLRSAERCARRRVASQARASLRDGIARAWRNATRPQLAIAGAVRPSPRSASPGPRGTERGAGAGGRRLLILRRSVEPGDDRAADRAAAGALAGRATRSSRSRPAGRNLADLPPQPRHARASAEATELSQPPRRRTNYLAPPSTPGAYRRMRLRVPSPPPTSGPR